MKIKTKIKSILQHFNFFWPVRWYVMQWSGYCTYSTCSIQIPAAQQYIQLACVSGLYITLHKGLSPCHGIVLQSGGLLLWGKLLFSFALVFTHTSKCYKWCPGVRVRVISFSRECLNNITHLTCETCPLSHCMVLTWVDIGSFPFPYIINLNF